MTQIDQSVFKAYDIRGIYPTQIDADLVYKIAQAYVKLLQTDAHGLEADGLTQALTPTLSHREREHKSPRPSRRRLSDGAAL